MNKCTDRRDTSVAMLHFFNVYLHKKYGFSAKVTLFSLSLGIMMNVKI